jgi:hypothetical protein
MSNTVAPGTVLADKYRLVSLLGRGGMGEVWRAEHLGLRAPVAIKLMNPEIVSNPEALARFNREAQAAASLRSPHVVQILDHGLDPGIQAPFIAMEMMEGESLAARIERVGRLSLADTARVVTHISRALARAHEAGIVHRDLKPDNVFLIRNDDEEIAKVLDFGIAKANSQSLGPGSATRTGALMGTPYYMSPEQITGAKGVDHRTDLWALGVIACQCLTGKLPFNGDTIGGLVIAICTEPIPRASQLGPCPLAFDGWFERALAREPAQRFQSARELAEELRRVCGLESTVPVPAGASLTAGAPFPATVGMAPVSAFSVGPVSHTSPQLPLHGPGWLGWMMGGGLALLACIGLAFWLFGPSRATPNGGSPSAAAAGLPPTAAPQTAPPAAIATEPLLATPPAAAGSPPSVAPAQRATTAAVSASPTVSPVRGKPSPAPLSHPAPITPAPIAPAPKPKPELDPTSVLDRRKG